MTSGLKLVDGVSNSDDVPDGPSNLLTAKEVGAYLRIPTKKVYELGIPRVVLSNRRVRWLTTDLHAYIRRSRVA